MATEREQVPLAKVRKARDGRGLIARRFHDRGFERVVQFGIIKAQSLRVKVEAQQVGDLIAQGIRIQVPP
jgi:hypothetical protein